MSIRTLVVLGVLASPLAPAAEPPAGTAPPAPPAVDAVAQTPAVDAVAQTPAVDAVAQTPAAGEAWRPGWQGTLGVGSYERLHVGVAWAPSGRSAVGVFGGSDLGLGTDSVWDLGLSYAHAVGRPVRRFQLGWDTKALYWQRSSPDYDWKMMSLLGGVYVARELRPGLTVALDAGVALSFSLDTTRKQNVNYEYPTRWNGSVCLELRYGFDR